MLVLLPPKTKSLMVVTTPVAPTLK